MLPLQNALLFAGYGAGERAVRRRGGADLTPVFVGESSRRRGGARRLPAARLTSATDAGARRPNGAGGTLGGIAQSLAVAPAELLKVQRQVGGRHLAQQLQVAVGKKARACRC